MSPVFDGIGINQFELLKNDIEIRRKLYSVYLDLFKNNANFS